MSKADEIVKEFIEYLDKTGPKPKPTLVSAAEYNRRVRRLLARERWEQRQRELPAERRQQAIDAVWEQTLEAKRELEEEAGFHRGPGDPDWPR